jgi:NADP-dependent 3-hydroxy acid dehydrogenase YdfG
VAELALVTGATSGIGRELARALIERGFEVLRAGEEHDLATPEGVEALYASLPRPVDILVLNAGVSEGGEFATGDLAAHLRLIDLNVRGTVHLAGLVIPAMAARGGGRVLLTSSMVAIMPGPFQATYNASKSFIQSFGLALRDELRDRGVSVTLVMPGPTDTNIFARAGQLDTPPRRVLAQGRPGRRRRAGGRGAAGRQGARGGGEPAAAARDPRRQRAPGRRQGPLEPVRRTAERSLTQPEVARRPAGRPSMHRSTEGGLR